MKHHIKWILVGLGFTFGLQVIISLIFTGIAYSNKSSAADVVSDTAAAVAFGAAVGAFLIGGFVVGWLTEELRIIDSLVVALLTLGLTLLMYTALPSGNRGQFVSGYLLSEPRRGVLFAVVALIVGVIGAYWGWHLKVPQEGRFDRIALLGGLVGAVVLPFALLAIGGRDQGAANAPGLPWYFLLIVLVLVLLIVGAGFVWFTHESHYDEEISISPEHHKEEGSTIN